MSKEKIEFEIGSGNVFKDLEFPNPDEMQAKAHLVFKIQDTITERKLKLDEAAEILCISKSELSDMLDGLFDSWTIDHLLSLLGKLDHDIEIVLHKRPANTPPAGLRISTSAD